MPSNKSSSSSSSSSVPSNPNPRSSEISNTMRRSFTGNPFAKPSVVTNPRSIFPNTPANSPSDIPRRNSVGVRESTGSLRDMMMDDKENGKDHQILKPAKVRSPAASSRSSKNFMAPTISASFKVTDSPRKKILIERNEPAPTSIPSADTKSHIRKVTFAEPLEEKKLDALLDEVTYFEESSLTSEDLSVRDADVPFIPTNSADLSFETVYDMNVPLISKNDTDLPFETAHDMHVPLSPDCVNLDPTFKLSPSTTPPVSITATILTPLDADPLMPPYDPKTNYLSPRPQFLHYKPKPRMELCNESEFEDSFISGSFSDSEVTEDTQSEGSHKESEDVSSNGTLKEEKGQISGPIHAKTLTPEETVEAKEAPKSRFSTRAKAVALILLLSVAFISITVTNSPVIDHTVFEDLYEVYEWSDFSEFARVNFDQFSQFAKANFDGLARNLHIWFTKSLWSISESLWSISELISIVPRVQNLAKLQYCNLTVMHDYTQYPVFGHGENEIGDTHQSVQNVQESDSALEIGTDEDVEDISAEHYEAYEEQVQQDIGVIAGAEHSSVAPSESEVLKCQAATVIESEHALPLIEVGNLELEAKLPQEVDANFNIENASDPPESEEVLKGQPATMIESDQVLPLAEAGNSEAKQTPEDHANFNFENDPKFNVDKQSDVGLKHWPDLDSEVAEIHTVRGNDQPIKAIEIPPSMVLYLLLCGGIVLIAGAAFNWSRKGKSRSKRITSSVGKPLFGKELQNKQISPDKPSLRNGPIEVVDVLGGEPCPSEMSSFQKSSSYSQKVAKQLNEAHSIEKKRRNNNRRESLASSSDYSMGSSSYGSLTVYEKYPSKQGSDEEMVTPVRRSSRIRNLATSPL
ncbi:uncharacterized protein LOC133291333 [Gastrolobium bilobum]|uniref:uncharacterized protein LOC133291333 n=1 Tax=Gastrolobium bilobum TaxID=150636 RepID=UPI002AB2F910|nr:uncharacterized protein LOC133291333 [Gastrolobium bilobum]